MRSWKPLIIYCLTSEASELHALSLFDFKSFLWFWPFCKPKIASALAQPSSQACRPLHQGSEGRHSPPHPVRPQEGKHTQITSNTCWYITLLRGKHSDGHSLTKVSWNDKSDCYLNVYLYIYIERKSIILGKRNSSCHGRWEKTYIELLVVWPTAMLGVPLSCSSSSAIMLNLCEDKTEVSFLCTWRERKAEIWKTKPWR